ncbi:MAG: threonylcarbamoyl-AMP synthase [Ruminococcaceae bacterium]|nr:threonylcarbamoyl-AMP synthase [Oscillospiraceae bacterium]
MIDTEIFKIDPENINGSAVARCAKIIKSGGLVAFPTETVYGLGADATDKTAAKKIYAAKGRPSDNPLIIHVARPEDAERYAYTCELYYRLAEAFMPGPLTVILKKRDIVPDEVTGGLDSVAVRCPSHAVARELIKAADVAIAAPSANLSGSPSPTCAEHVAGDMSGRIDAIIDGGICEIGLESTIVKIDGESVTMLRPGGITVDALRCVCEHVEIASAVTEALGENERPLSPGMKYRHYAPSAQLVLLDGKDSDVTEFFLNAQKNENCALICYSEELSVLDGRKVIDVGARDDLASQAQRLFGALREADGFGADVIYAHLPKQEGLGLALYNRLIRAAAHTVKKI